MCPIASCGAIYERNEQARHMKESINEHIFCLNKTLSQHQEIIYMQNKIIVEQREKIERLESHVNLITHNKEWKGLVDKLVKAAEEDGPEALVTLMKTHKHNTGVISRCCESMTNVCKTDPKSRTNFRDVGACEVRNPLIVCGYEKKILSCFLVYEKLAPSALQLYMFQKQ